PLGIHCALRALLAAASTVAVRGKLHFVHLSTPGRPNPNSLREFLVPLTSVALITSKDSGY
ncbi:MAG: hypothetical protein ACM3ZE_03640, partial [Myxococcales bacterium]